MTCQPTGPHSQKGTLSSRSQLPFASQKTNTELGGCSHVSGDVGLTRGADWVNLALRNVQPFVE